MLKTLRDFCLTLGLERTYWVAYSGGLDSHVLLSLCHALQAIIPIKLKALHINHGVHQAAQAWEQHCATVCKTLQIEYLSHSIQIDLKTGESFEEVAREKRYQVFADYMQAGDVLLTAHQEDDQAETVLLQLCRGAGPKGLSAMPRLKPFGQGFQGRPLLTFSRAVLLNYAKENNLHWIEDDSNENTQLTRNFLRHDILSVLKTRWPSVATMISRSAAHCAESQAILEEFAQNAYHTIKGSSANTLSVKKLLQLDRPQQKWLLRTWISRIGFPVPSANKMETILQDMLLAAPDRTPCVEWEKTELRRFRDDLYLMQPLPKFDSTDRVFDWHLTQNLSLPNGITLQAKPVMGRGLRGDIERIVVRFRQGGERLWIKERGATHTLKNLFQEWQIPPWERDRLPLLFIADKLIGVLGYFLDQDFMAKKGEQGYELTHCG